MIQSNIVFPPFQRHSDTSRSAAQAIEPKANTLRALVLAAVRQSPWGLTDEQISAATGLSGSTARPRRIELCEAGLIRATNIRAKTAAGRLASVWEAK